MKKPIVIVFIAIAAILGAKAQQPDTARENIAIRRLIRNYEDAWNRHDAKGLADNYTDDATWVNWFGAYYKRRADIQFHYQQVHNTYFKLPGIIQGL